MKSIFDETTKNELEERIALLNENSERKWGKMTVGQMAWHCQYPLKLAIENKPSSKKGNLLAQLFFKKSMYNNKAWRKNLPTAPQLKAREPKNFSDEVKVLQQLMYDMHQLKSREAWNAHPFFGHFTKEQWGQVQYKHLDHHLTQFGV
ncbi:DUF1569 domain-containing protein [Cellulophaga sp. E16_2]|uniref:DUF1569 domain-containing protein n=1 Tax=Cellulophaga algicola (strain DSM 14237 / IC166 / ACAM 630) TaxID=688270 RepID=E6XD69_CELAD|nr:MULTISPECIES: DUF1569 domain-containing protein [Cellulophaga]ADV47982.1 hypothetical protein Celal_0643 [Cellulophaga algicola DSM 14237]MBO0590442.1 DUF1569 domain-containing protein [Cellulophaga sp. E16_2]